MQWKKSAAIEKNNTRACVCACVCVQVKWKQQVYPSGGNRTLNHRADEPFSVHLQVSAVNNKPMG